MHTSYALLKELTIDELREQRLALLNQDAYDFDHQESISEHVFRIDYELRVVRNVTV